MKPYYSNIETETLENTNFRKVLYTGSHMQLVVMSLNVGEDIGEEVHDMVDQFFRVEKGQATFIVEGVDQIVSEDEVFIVPAGSKHNVVNSGSVVLKLYTIYSPANHPEGTVHKTRAEAMAAEEHDH